MIEFLIYAPNPKAVTSRHTQKRLLILCLLTVIAVVEIVSAGQGREVPCFGTELEE